MTSANDTARFERTTLPGGLRLAINSNHKLKTILVKGYFAADLDETVTHRALLPLVLRRGTRRRPDLQTLNRHLEGLYGAGLYTSVIKVGEWHLTRLRLEVVNDRFLPERHPGKEASLLGEGLEFLRELLHDPVIEEGTLRPEYVAQEAESLRRTIESLIDDKGAYASFRCAEEMCRDEPYRLSEQGRAQDLESVDPGALHEEWARWYLRTAPSLYVAGDVDPSEVRERVARVFDSDWSGPAPLAPVPAPVEVGEPREVREQLDVQQGKLVLGFRHGVTYGDPRYEALLLMNGVLGAFSHSKLFQNVREKESLAYSAYSWPERTKGLLFISCGIAPENFDRARDICLRQVEAVRRGEISDDEIHATVETFLNQNRMLEDNYSSLADVDYVWGLHGRDLDLPRLRERVGRVTRDEIVEVARCLRHDMTYFLHS